MIREYKIVTPESFWVYKDEVFEDLFNKYASQGWCVISVAYTASGNIKKGSFRTRKK